MSIHALSDQLADIVAQAGAWVVAVSARQRFSSSGIHWQRGVIVTANHTVKRDEDLAATLPDGRSAPLQLVGRDPGSDLAVLRLADEHADFPTATTVATDKLRVGHLVVAVARSPEDGLGASAGLLSSLSGPWKSWRGAQLDAFIQPDLNLYPGFSGSALVTLDGRVIGMNTSGLSRMMAVTVPASTVGARVERILAHGGVAPGYLGIAMQPVRLPADLGLDRDVGVMLLNVEPGSPAATAGLLLGDVLLSLGGAATSDIEDVLAQLDPDQIGKTLPARVLRGGSVKDIQITVGERP
jgi:S1-C subfamily serine protease